MSNRSIRIAVLLAASLTAAPAALLAAAASGGDAVPLQPGPAAAGGHLPLEDILATARAIQPGRILEAELDDEEDWQRLVWEVYVRDDRGVVWELYLDPVDGALLERERD